MIDEHVLTHARIEFNPAMPAPKKNSNAAKPPDERAEAMLRIRLQHDRKERYTQAAESAGQDLSKFVLEACDEHLKRQARKQHRAHR